MSDNYRLRSQSAIAGEKAAAASTAIKDEVARLAAQWGVSNTRANQAGTARQPASVAIRPRPAGSRLGHNFRLAATRA